MSYKVLNNQTGAEQGYVKYEFYLRFKGQRYRRVETCRRSAEKEIHKDWEDYIINGQLQNKQYKLFEITDRYLEYSRRKKPELYQHEKKALLI